jgi:hypothetical protein
MDESENERMHLMTFMELWQPSTAQRALVIGAQAVFCAGYWASYVLFPRTSHRFVGTMHPHYCFILPLLIFRAMTMTQSNSSLCVNTPRRLS